MATALRFQPLDADFYLCSDDSSLSWVGLAWSLGTVRKSYLKRCWLLSEKKGDLRGDHRFQELRLALEVRGHFGVGRAASREAD